MSEIQALVELLNFDSARKHGNFTITFEDGTEAKVTGIVRIAEVRIQGQERPQLEVRWRLDPGECQITYRRSR